MKKKKRQEKSQKKEINLKYIRQLITDIIEYDYNKLIDDLNIKKGLEIERIKKTKKKTRENKTIKNNS